MTAVLQVDDAGRLMSGEGPIQWRCQKDGPTFVHFVKFRMVSEAYSKSQKNAAICKQEKMPAKITGKSESVLATMC